MAGAPALKRFPEALMTTHLRYLLAILFVTMPAAFPARADIVASIRFQGRIAKPDGLPLPDGGYFVTFALYEQQTGGTALWQEKKAVAKDHGCIIKDTTQGQISTYRWHVEDAKPFDTSIRVTIEHGTNNDTEADYSSVAFWYQSEPHAAFPAFPTNHALLLPYVAPPPYQIPNAIEGESLVATAQATSGNAEAQDMTTFATGWSGNQQLWWRPTASGAILTLQAPAPAAGTFSLTGYFTKVMDYVKMQIRLGAQNIGAEQTLYDPNVVPTGAVAFGNVTLVAGSNTFKVNVTGRDAASTGYLFGLDAFVLTPS